MAVRLLTMLLAVLMLLTGCGGEDTGPAAAEFTQSGLTMTLTEEFGAKQYPTYTACYVTESLAVFTLKEELGMFDPSLITGSSTPADYADLVWRANGLGDGMELQQGDGLTWFEYTRYVNGRNHTYRVYAFKAPDAFWTVQFAAFTEDFSELADSIHEYAKTVRFE